MPELKAGLENSWRSTAVAIYESWFNYLKERDADRQTPIAVGRRPSRGQRTQRPTKKMPSILKTSA